MTIKILVLKSGEDVIADVSEMISPEERLLGYFMKKPYVIKVLHNESFDSEPNSKKNSQFSIKLYPWMPIAKEKTMPIPVDWVVSMVTPLDKLKDLYVNSLGKKNTDEKDDINIWLENDENGHDDGDEESDRNEDDQSDSVSEQ